MSNSATIVAAALDSSKLEQSINELVATVAAKTKKMADNFTSEVKRMEQAVKNIGNIKIDSGGTADGGSSRRTSKQKEEEGQVKATTQAYKEQRITLDQQATAMQNAIRPKSAEDSYYTIIKNMRENVALLAMEIKSLPNISLDKQFGAYMQYERQIEGVRQRIAELRQQMQEMANDPNASRLVKKQTLEEINSLQQKIVQLEHEQITATQQIANADKQVLAEKQAQYEKQKQELIQLSAGERERVTFSKELASDAHKHTEEIRKQAQAIRESQQYQKGERVVIATKQDGTEILAFSEKRLSLEEQIANARKTVAEETAKQKMAEEETAQATRLTGDELKKIYQDQKTVNEEINKRANGVRNGGTTPFQSYDSLRQSIASVLGIQEQQVKMANTEKDSYNQLSSTLKQLRQAYDALSKSDRNSDQGKVLVASMHEVERAMQRIKAQAARPVSLESIVGINGKGGLSEKTLDDIAYKMRQLASYRSGLNVETQKKEIGQVNAEYDRLKKKMDEVMQKNQSMIASNNALGRSWNYMKNRLAFYFTVGASTQFVKNLIDIRGQYELLERSIGILIDSAQNGSQIFAELNSMAIKSPFTTMELGAAAKQLVAYDVAAKDVVETTRRLADMAAAVGIPIERLTYALGQIKAYGYLNARDARMFANAGIPLVKELADRYTELEGRLVSTSDVYDRIKKKAISYEDVMATVNKMTDEGGKFFNFQEKAADTLKVRIANLTLAWNNMMNEIGAANQGVLSSGLKTLSDVFKNWRSIYNLITSIIVTFGVLKGTQIAVLTMQAMKLKENITLWNALEISMRKSIGAAFVNQLRSIGGLLAKFANPVYLAAAAVTALSVALLKTFYDYQDLIAANEAFNKSISDNAKENIESIDKFFEDYKKQFSNVGGLNSADQEKLWERIQEEIEKTTKNAKEYIDVLNDVAKTSSKIQFGEEILEHSKTMQDELKRLADSGTFSIGGGFANDSAAENLQKYQEALNEIRQEYGSVDAAIEAHTLKSRKLMAEYETQRDEVRKELNDFVSKLDSAYIPNILGQSDDVRIQMANVRSFAESLRDAFLATEKGSKIGADGIVMLNNAIDKWITKQGIANNLIVNANGEFDEQRARIEKNKTAWEEFFRYISNKDKEYLDAAIKTNNIGSDEVKKIWDKAAEEMSKRAATSYELIQDQIAQLRNTPDIVINVVYKNAKQKLDKDQEEFEKKYIQPKDWGVLSPDKYLEQEKANREKYGTLMRKQGEDTVEYEKRISDERKTNLELQKKNGDIIEENKNKTDAYSQSVTEQARKEKKATDDRLKAIKEIEDASGYDFSTKSENAAARKAQKQSESELAKALKDELSTIDKVRSIYKDLTKEGMSHADAVERATRGWKETVNAINRVLQKNGLQKLDLSKFAGIENPRELINMLHSQLNTLLKRGAKPAEIKELQTKIQTLNVDADKYDLTKITKGLNSELDKLKDEYELALELDANPELGDMFADMFGIDTNTLPQTFGDALDSAQDIINRKLAELNVSSPFDLMQTDINEFANSARLEKESEAIKELAKWQGTFRDMFKKNLADSEKMLDDYIKKYGNYSDKIAEIEASRLEKLKKLNETYYTEEMRKRPEYAAKLNAIEQGARKEKQQVDFDEFKNSRYYTMMFENLDYVSTKTIRDMRDRLRELMDSMKDLMPEQLKQVMSQYEKLEQKLTKRSPFKTLTKDLKNYLKTSGDRKVANEAFRNAQKEYDAQEKNVAALKEKYEQAKANNNTSQSYLDFLKIEIDGENEILQYLKEQLRIAEEKADKYNLTAKLAKSEMLQVAQMVATNLKGLAELRDQMNELFGVDASKGETLLGHNIDGMIDSLAKASDGISKITSSAQSGNAFGVVGGVVDVFTGVGDAIASIFGDGAARTRRLNREINKSKETVRQLSMAYDDLERAVNKSLGTAETEARRAAIANKELQLTELERQKALEESKRSKDRDDDAIKQYEESIHSLRNEISDLKEDVVNNLWGEDVKSAAEAFVDTWVSAWRAGKTTLKDIKDEMNDIMLNIVKKGVSSKIVEGYLSPIYNELDRMTKEGSLGGMALTNEELKAIADMSKTAAVNIDDALKALYGQLNLLGVVKPDNNLSALQQGISGITEDTAGALEAITSGMSQQVYYQSTLLEQIRDSVVAMDFDINLGVMSQILLQLQTSYQTQQTIQSILEGWSSPSGLAVRVEMQ